MLIDISEILSVKDKVLTVEAPIEMEELQIDGHSYSFVQKQPVSFVFTNIGKRQFMLKAKIDVVLILPCDRCLTDVKQQFSLGVSKEIDMNKSDTWEREFITDASFDVEKFVYDEILVNLPMKVLCKTDCKGLCNRCGTNLNLMTCDCDTTELDFRMSKVLDIFNQFKEV